MKLSTIAITITLTVSSFSSMAHNVIFKPVENNLETQVCYLAATEGLDAAKARVKEEGINFSKFDSALSCNGLSLREFADQYKPQTFAETKAEPKPAIKLIANNADIGSKVCVEALVVGVERAKQKNNVAAYNITCNDQDIKSFVRKYSKQNIAVESFAE